MFSHLLVFILVFYKKFPITFLSFLYFNILFAVHCLTCSEIYSYALILSIPQMSDTPSFKKYTSFWSALYTDFIFLYPSPTCTFISWGGWYVPMGMEIIYFSSLTWGVVEIPLLVGATNNSSVSTQIDPSVSTQLMSALGTPILGNIGILYP